MTFRKKVEMNINNHTSHHSSMVTKPLSTSKKKRSTPKVAKTNNIPIVSVFIFHVICLKVKFYHKTIILIEIFLPQVQSSNNMVPMSLMSDGHMTPEEVERHLESRQTYLELVPEKAPPTVPTEMFSNDPSLDR